MPEFVVELFSPTADATGRRDLIRRAEAVPSPARYVRSIYLPTDEILLVVIHAASSADAARLTGDAGLPVDRITEAALDP